MEQENNLVAARLLHLAEFQVRLIRKGGPTADCDLFEDILHQQDEILKNFGLPVSQDYEELVGFKSVPTTTELNQRIEKLHVAAVNYLTPDTKSDLDLLNEVVETGGDAMIVLPELKIATHAYTTFVFDEILIKKKDTAPNVLSELRLCNQWAILDALGKVQNDFDEKLFGFLDILGLKYLNEYVDHGNR